MRIVAAAMLAVICLRAANLAEIRGLINSGKRAEARQLATQWLEAKPAGIERAEALNALGASIAMHLALIRNPPMRLSF